MRARTHTQTHLFHRSCHCWKHRRKASSGIFRSSAIPIDLMSSMVAKRAPLMPIFRVENSQKSLGGRSGECGVWVMTGMLFSAKNCCTTSDVWLGALSWCRNNSLPLVAPFPPNFIAQPLQIFCHHPTTELSGSRSEWLLALPCSEKGPEGDAFRNHGGHQIKCDGRTPEDSKRSLPPVLQGSMEQVCVCAYVRNGPTFEGD